jgi:hypothetical protein
VLDFLGTDFSFRQRNRGLDRGKREALDAVAVELEIAHLGREKRAIDRRGIVVARQQRTVALVRFLEDALVMPKGVVGIEADDELACSHAAAWHARNAREAQKQKRGAQRAAFRSIKLYRGQRQAPCT